MFCFFCEQVYLLRFKKKKQNKDPCKKANAQLKEIQHRKVVSTFQIKSNKCLIFLCVAFFLLQNNILMLDKAASVWRVASGSWRIKNQKRKKGCHNTWSCSPEQNNACSSKTKEKELPQHVDFACTKKGKENWKQRNFLFWDSHEWLHLLQHQKLLLVPHVLESFILQCFLKNNGKKVTFLYYKATPFFNFLSLHKVHKLMTKK